MKTLPQTLRKNGFTYIQVRRGRRSCLYEQRHSDIVVGYEVFLIRTSRERHIAGKILEAKEVFPNNSAFGYWAWSFYTLEKALIKFQSLEMKPHTHANQI